MIYYRHYNILSPTLIIMSINIKLSTELEETLSLDDVTTNKDLYLKISSTLDNLPPSFKLILNGERLQNNSTVLNKVDDMSVILMSDKKKKVKCSFQNCNSPPLRMVGTCQSCSGKFCAKHRLFEDHRCEGLNSYKLKQKERNGLKLLSEATKV